MENGNLIPESTLLEPAPEDLDKELAAREKKIMIWVIVGAIIILVILILSIILLAQAPPETVAQIRDIFIIFMGLQSLLIGLVLIILIIQMSRLINLLNVEIKPILDSTNETANNLRGTTTFLSENLVEPVIRLNEHLAAITQLFAVLGVARRSSKKK